MDMNLYKFQVIVKDKGAWHAAVHASCKELDMTEQLNDKNNREINWFEILILSVKSFYNSP